MFVDNIYSQEYFYEGNNHQLIFFIHGLYASPAQFEKFYPVLKAKGYSIYTILLEGHGKELRELAKVKYTEWVKQIDDRLKERFKQYEAIFLVGHSMGGILAIDTNDDYITKRILIAPAIRVKFTWQFFHLGLVINNDKVQDTYTNSSRKILGVVFPLGFFKKLIALFCFWQLFKLIHYTNINLKKIHKPILVMQSYRDECVREKGPKTIIEHIASTEKEIVWYKSSLHAVFDPYEEQMMVKEIIKFIKGEKNE